MKAEHRHELKTNELADWMAHFPEWSKKNAKPLIGGTALVVLIVVVVMWSQYNNTIGAQEHRSQFTENLATQEMTVMQVVQASSQGDDTSMILGDTATALGQLAKNASKDPMSALAYIKQAETLREQTQFENGQPDAQAVTDRIEAAKAAYTKGLELAKKNASLAALAQYGLGLCAEELGQYAEAKSIYEGMVSNDTYAGTTAQTSAQNRLKVVDAYQNTITFPVVEEVEEVVSEDTPVIPLPALDSNLAPVQPEIGPSLPEVMPATSPNTPPTDSNTSE